MVMDELLTPMEWEMLRSYHSLCLGKMLGQCATEEGKKWLQKEAQEWLN